MAETIRDDFGRKLTKDQGTRKDRSVKITQENKFI